MEQMSLDTVREHVIHAWRSVLPEAALNQPFFDQGGGSLAAALLVAQLEQSLGVELPFGVLATSDGVEGLVHWIQTNRS
jgi:acyl carrier protein